MLIQNVLSSQDTEIFLPQIDNKLIINNHQNIKIRNLSRTGFSIQQFKNLRILRKGKLRPCFQKWNRLCAFQKVQRQSHYHRKKILFCTWQHYTSAFKFSKKNQFKRVFNFWKILLVEVSSVSRKKKIPLMENGKLSAIF